MKKIIFAFALFVAFSVSAQDSYYTMYRFVVEPQNQATVYKLVDDYYSKNKPEGFLSASLKMTFQGVRPTISIFFPAPRRLWETCTEGAPTTLFHFS